MSLWQTIWAWEMGHTPSQRLALLALADMSPGEGEWFSLSSRRWEVFRQKACMDEARATMELWGLERDGFIRASSREDNMWILLFPELESSQTLTGQSPRPPRRTKSNRGWVYLIESGGFHKIGKTKNLEGRLAALRTSSPLPVEVIATLGAADCGELERTLHELFAEKRTNGEWFLLTEADIEGIKEMRE